MADLSSIATPASDGTVLTSDETERQPQDLVALSATESIEIQRRLEVIQQLLRYQGTEGYRSRQQQSATQLGISVRSLRRMVRSWREQGLAGLRRQQRSDRGERKVSRDWQQFILKTYRDGNRGSRRMSVAQVAIRVQVRAQELGVRDYPGRTTVYRILQPHIEKSQQQKRSILRRNPAGSGGAAMG